MRNMSLPQTALLAAILGGFFLFSYAHAGPAGTDMSSVSRLPEGQILSQTRESIIAALGDKRWRPSQMLDSNWIVVDLNKRIILNSWEIVAYRPGGERVPVTEPTKRAILGEIRKHFGPDIADERVLPWIEVYSDVISGPVRQEAEELWRYRPGSRKGDVYFVPFQKGTYHVFIIGELGDFVSVFVKSQQEKPECETILADLLPEINLVRKGSRPPRTALTIWAGETKGPDGTFYRVRVNVEATELITGVDLPAVYGWQTSLDPLDDPVKRSIPAPGFLKEAVGVKMSAVRTGEGLIKEELSIAPKSNFKRRGLYVGLTPAESDNVTRTIQCGVYGDPNEALAVFRDHLEHAAASPRDIDEKPPGHKSVGWWNEDYGDFERILFIRDNAVVDLRLLPGTVHSYRSVKEMAWWLDGVLRADGKDSYGHGMEWGARRASRVQVPRIAAVEMPSEAVAGSTVEAEVSIVVPDGQTGQSGLDKEVEITRTIRFIVPGTDATAANESGDEMTFELTYITSDCRVASRKVVLTVRPPAPRTRE